ncbi:helix-turn-helix transcriptional regulator, partial [Vibrio parahaemolyticus]|nr:helix-turn-helix transcriptional regulator [Vibrio parahaemolyticus]
MSKTNPFPQRLKQARNRVGISQRELGIRLGMDPSS